MNQRGSAVVEGALAAVFLSGVTCATLLAGYAVLGRAYVEYQSEQALYCLSEGKSSGRCRNVFSRSVAGTLPYGRVSELVLSTGRDQWRIRLVWNLLDFKFRVQKSLSTRRILGRAAS